MKHLGDITKIDGTAIEPVDVVFGGSPCQDLSVAGNRAGLDGERSGLFMEYIRIVKEMRYADREFRGRADADCRPRYLGWENVGGTFSSNGGRDFQKVLTEIIRIKIPDAPDVPMPDGGWSRAGCLYDEMASVSLAWRVHSAQFWGVPQRRVRVALIADFGGLTAPEILFEPQGLRRHFTKGEEPLERTPADARTSIKGASGGECYAIENHPNDSRVKVDPNGISQALSGRCGTGGNNTPCVMVDSSPRKIMKCILSGKDNLIKYQTKKV